MLTAAITAAIAAILSVFGIKPGPYLVVVAVVVKVAIIGAGVLFGARWMRRRNAQAAAKAPEPGEEPKPS